MRCGRLMLAGAFLLTSCATKGTVSFQTDTKGKVAIVDWDDLGGEGEKVGDTPMTLKISELANKVVRVSAANKQSEYWVVSCDERRDRLVAKIKMQDKVCAETAKTADNKDKNRDHPDSVREGEKPPGLSVTALNKSHRQILRAYEALVSNDLTLARNIASQLASETPELASPFIIIGLTYLRSGDRQNARVAFTRAATLDPDDPSTRELMKMTQF